MVHGAVSPDQSLIFDAHFSIDDTLLSDLGYEPNESLTFTLPNDTITVMTSPLAPIPEPSTYIGLASLAAVLGLVTVARRKREDCKQAA